MELGAQNSVDGEERKCSTQKDDLKERPLTKSPKMDEMVWVCWKMKHCKERDDLYGQPLSSCPKMDETVWLRKKENAAHKWAVLMGVPSLNIQRCLNMVQLGRKSFLQNKFVSAKKSVVSMAKPSANIQPWMMGRKCVGSH